jgi:OmpA-OmpF porin, OOP family
MMNSMNFKRIIVGCLLIFTAPVLLAQKKTAPNKGKKWPNVGFAYNLVDSDPSLPKKDSIYGFSAMYWQGLSKKFDLSVRYNGIFSNKINNSFFSPNKNRMSSEFEIALHAKALRDRNAINLFLTAGVGVSNYKEGSWNRYELAGGGLQINLSSEFYFLIQANYRYSLDLNKFPHNTFYSIGLTRSIHSKQKNKPVRDRDGDGVTDNVDACPDSAGLVALQGCPDRDGDGIADKDDKCPDIKGVTRYNGCPIPDTDKDGINDEEDKCPTVMGVIRYKGCPVPDTDKDGINDEEDKCPNMPGVKENQGCPPIPVELKKKVTTAARNILFVTASAELQTKSFVGLNEVVRIMKQNPKMMLSIDGHTDSVGTDEHNQLLSENRAASVKIYIVSQGIDESRITSAGHGELEPIADNGKPAGRRLNRRVEMKLSYYK